MLAGLGVFTSFAVTVKPLPELQVVTEESIYAFDDPKNGSGPLWSYGCTQIVRDGTSVIVSQMETGKDVPPLCNTRWRLLRRGKESWDLIAEAGKGRAQRHLPDRRRSQDHSSSRCESLSPSIRNPPITSSQIPRSKACPRRPEAASPRVLPWRRGWSR